MMVMKCGRCHKIIGDNETCISVVILNRATHLCAACSDSLEEWMTGEPCNYYRHEEEKYLRFMEDQ